MVYRVRLQSESSYRTNDHQRHHADANVHSSLLRGVSALLRPPQMDILCIYR